MNQLFKNNKKTEDKPMPDLVLWHEKLFNIYQRDKLQKIIIMLLTCLCAVLGYGTFTNQVTVETVIVRIDKLGVPISAEIADGTDLPEITENEIEKTLRRITESWRYKGIDKRNEKRLFSVVFNHMSDPAARKFTSIVNAGNLYPFVKDVKDYDPLEDIGDFTADAEFVSIIRTGTQTYQLRYLETVWNKQGGVQHKYIVIVSYTISQFKPTSIEEVKRNPFGIYIIDLSATTEVYSE